MNDAARNRQDRDDPASHPQKTKASGWKVPLLFCGGLLIIVGLVAFLRGGPPPLPPLPAALLEQAQTISIALKDPEGEGWKNRITSDATGLEPRQNKDAKLHALIPEALRAGREDAACMAAVLIADVQKRDAAFKQIYTHGLSSCDKLVWSVFAIRGATPEKAALWAPEVNTRWEICTGR